LSEYHLSTNLRFFLGLRGAAFIAPLEPHSAADFFISYLCHAKEDHLVLLGSGSLHP